MSTDSENKSQFSICLEVEEMKRLAAARKHLEKSIGFPISRNKIIKKLLFEHPVFERNVNGEN
jgi:hypothetical protein